MCFMKTHNYTHAHAHTHTHARTHIHMHTHTRPAATMRLEEFHQNFLNDFTPVVVKYIDTLEGSLKQDLACSLANETWLPIS